MFNREIFSKRFKLLRVVHKLSTSAIAELLNLKSKGSINAFETQRGVPSIEVLTDISNLFAVSLDWLADRVESPYNNELLLKLEKELLQSLEEVSTLENMGYFRTTTLLVIKNSNYYDPATRGEFSLAVRANILFLLNWFKHMSNELYVNSNIKSFDDFRRVLNTKLTQQSGGGSRIKIDPRWKACVENLSILQDILNKKVVIKPIFDITETFGIKHMASDFKVDSDEQIYNIIIEAQKSGVSEADRQLIGEVIVNLKDMIRTTEEKILNPPCNKD